MQDLESKLRVLSVEPKEIVSANQKAIFRENWKKWIRYYELTPQGIKRYIEAQIPILKAWISGRHTGKIPCDPFLDCRFDEFGSFQKSHPLRPIRAEAFLYLLEDMIQQDAYYL